MPEYLPVNRAAVTMQSRIPFKFGLTASEILSFRLNVHRIRLSLRQLRRILKNRGRLIKEARKDFFVNVLFAKQ